MFEECSENEKQSQHGKDNMTEYVQQEFPKDRCMHRVPSESEKQQATPDVFLCVCQGKGV